MEYIALDVHKNYTWARVENAKGDRLYESRLAHSHGTIKNFVNRWAGGSPVAVETVGYWVVDEIEAGGGTPQRVNARLAKLMMGNVNKSDKLDCKGMNYGHIHRLYQRLKSRRGHGKAKVAVARHLSEASFWMLNKGEPYREPMSSTTLSAFAS
jgi:hypothetical protein